MKLSGALCVVLLAGCGGASVGVVTSAEWSPPPVLSFNADFTETQSGPLVAGAQAVLHFDPARLPECRGVYQGVPAWTITGSFAADGGAATQVAMVGPSRAGFLVGVDQLITVPTGHDLAVWFENSDPLGCTAWDSDYGRNYHFAIGAPPAATLHFQAGYTTSVDGTPRAGAPLAVDFDLTRLPICRQDYNGLPTWDVAVDYRFDGGAIAQASLTTIDGDTRVGAPARILVPAVAHTIELWFENWDRTGCHTWDSDYGRNYSFDLE